ncbi:MAG: hypothetical protein U5L45_16280 [Saprospiraceae bacterium]|nr:hypothetical protein [Saprospiraceae bacterium]
MIHHGSLSVGEPIEYRIFILNAIDVIPCLLQHIIGVGGFTEFCTRGIVEGLDAVAARIFRLCQTTFTPPQYFSVLPAFQRTS